MWLTISCPDIGRQYGVKNKAAIALQCKLNGKIIAALVFIAHSCSCQNLVIRYSFAKLRYDEFHSYFHFKYTLSHPENDRDVNERVQGSSRIHATRRILYASIPVFLFERVKVARAMARVSSGMRADVTVVLEVRQSIDITLSPFLFCYTALVLTCTLNAMVLWCISWTLFKKGGNCQIHNVFIQCEDFPLLSGVKGHQLCRGEI